MELAPGGDLVKYVDKTSQAGVCVEVERVHTHKVKSPGKPCMCSASYAAGLLGLATFCMSWHVYRMPAVTETGRVSVQYVSAAQLGWTPCKFVVLA